MRSADSFGARTHDAGIGPGLGEQRCMRTGVGASVTGCSSLQPASKPVADKSDNSAGRLPESVPTGRVLSFPPRRLNDGKRDDARAPTAGLTRGLCAQVRLVRLASLPRAESLRNCYSRIEMMHSLY